MAAFRAGDTFLLAHINQKHHLHVVLCDPAGKPSTILVVSFNTVTLNTDTTVTLEPGDHPFISRRTAVSYDLMRLMPVEELDALERLCAAGLGDSFRRHNPVSPELLKRIRQGALMSDLTPKGMVRTLKERLGIESGDDL